jgi:hypothetical protein
MSLFGVLDLKAEGRVDCFQTQRDYVDEDDAPGTPLESIENWYGDLEWVGWVLDNFLSDNEGGVNCSNRKSDQTTDDQNMGES